MSKLVVIKGPLTGQVFNLGDKDIVFCGRYPRMNDVAILEIAVSRKHFKLFKIGRDYFVEDLNSKHGTYVNDELVEPGEGFQVNEGDLITVGNTVMCLTGLGGDNTVVKTLTQNRHLNEDSLSNGQPQNDRRTTKELELTYSVSELLRQHMPIESFFKEFIDLLLDALPRLDNVSIFLFENDRNDNLEVKEVFSNSDEKSVPVYKKKILNKIMLEHKTIRLSDTDIEFPDSSIEECDTLEIKSLLCVPIIGGNKVLGAIYIDSKKPYGFRKRDQLLLNSFVGPLALAIEKEHMSRVVFSDNHAPFKNKLKYLFRKN